MPSYIYRCKECSEENEVFHGMMEDLEACVSCGSSSIYRVPQKTTVRHISKNDVGEKVRRAIEENRELLNNQKKTRKEVEK